MSNQVDLRAGVRCRLHIALAGVMACLAGQVAFADVNQARVQGLKYLVQTQRGDGSWSSALGDLDVQATANAIHAMGRGGLRSSPNYASALSWIANAESQSTDSLARRAIALSDGGLGLAAQTIADELYETRNVSTHALWGGYEGHATSYFDTALGLSALRVADRNFGAKVSGPVANAVCELMVNRVVPAAGQSAWSMAPAAPGQSITTTRPSVLATALVMGELEALRAVAISSVTCNTVEFNLATVVGQAHAWLQQRQNAIDGGFGELRSNGSQGVSSVFVSATVYQALASLPSPPQPAASNVLNYLVAQQNPDGSWRGDAFMTTQVLAAIVPATGAQSLDTDNDGIPNVVEQALGRNELVADSAGALAAPSLSVSGVTATSFAAQGQVGVPFTYAMQTGGSLISIVSGALPPGLMLNTTDGVISGTPARGGSWSFEFERDGTGTPQTVIGRIDVVSAQDPGSTDGDVPLPGWALLALGGALLGAVQRRTRR
jgi:hypothetical protein